MYPEKLPDGAHYCYSEQEIFEQKGRRGVFVYLENEYRVGMHIHDFHELIIVLGGKGCHYIGEMKTPIYPGDVFVIPPGVSHGYYCEENCTLSVCYFLFPALFMKKYYQDMLTLPGCRALFELEPYLRSVYESRLFLHLGKEKLGEIRERALCLIERRGESAVYADFQALGIVSELSRIMQSEQEELRQIKRGDSEILSLLDYIEDHIEEKITIEDLAAYANMSRATLHRRFRAVTRLSPMEYVMERRLHIAEKLLQESEMSHAEIAQRCGFFDTAHLNHRLKRKQNKFG